MQLYRANISLSQEMYGVIGIFEIVLRNSIDRHFINLKGNTWLEDAVSDGGYLDTSPGCEDSFHAVHDAIHVLGLNYTHDRLIAKFSLGFWRYQFGKKEFPASGSTLLDVFVNRPFGTNRKSIFSALSQINDLRNRIAHYEPICFHNNIVSTAKVSDTYNRIINLLTWLGCNPANLLFGIDGVRKVINSINGNFVLQFSN